LIQRPTGLKIYGAGIVSSAGETPFSIENPSPNRIGFDLERVMRTDYRIDDYQQLYVVIDSFEQLLDATQQDFGPIYDRLSADETRYNVIDLIDADHIITRGTQAYARQKAG
jgi:phenylalanine-4-hydroxylase